MTNSKDLFDDNAMSFGDHLEALRIHLWKSIIGLIVCCIFTLLFSGNVIAFIRGPIDTALQKHGQVANDDVSNFNLFEFLFSEPKQDESMKKNEKDQYTDTLTVNIRQKDLEQALHQMDPEKYPAPKPEKSPQKKNETDQEKKDPEPNKETPENPEEKKEADQSEDPDPNQDRVSIEIASPLFKQMKKVVGDQNKPVVLTVQEPFMTYLKVALISGLVMSSPWIFYQLWLFVAAGLYPHEQKYVYRYLPLTLGLFFGGALFCFYLVFPFILDFLLGFADLLGVNPQIRLSEWISFALMLPFMFGLSFQLPVVMLFLERISIFEADDYREKRRLAILVIAIISMLMTPADPMSMIMMMIPLVVLYEFGILLCGKKTPPESPFDESDAF